MKVSSSGKSYGKSTIAVNRDLDKSKTDFIPFTCFGKTAEVLEKYVKKGNLVCLEGSIQIENYEKDGVKKSFTSMIVSKIEFLPNGTKGDNDEYANKGKDNNNNSSSSENNSNGLDDDDDFPF